MSLCIKPLFQALTLSYAVFLGRQATTEGQDVKPSINKSETYIGIRPTPFLVAQATKTDRLNLNNDALEKGISKLIKGLDNDSYKVREDCQKKLLEIPNKLKIQELKYFINRLLLERGNSLESERRISKIAGKLYETDIRFKLAFLCNESVPEHFRNNLHRESEEVKFVLAESTYVAKWVLEELSKDPNYEIRDPVAKNPKATKEILELLSRDTFALIRSHVARNKNLTKETLKVLSMDESIFVKVGVIENPNVTKEIMTTFLKDSDRRSRSAVGQNLSVKEILEILSNNPDVCIRGGIARNVNATEEILEILSKDPELYVRSGVAENQNTSNKVLEILSRDHEPYIRYSVAINPKTSKEILATLLSNSWGPYVDSIDIRYGVAGNPNATKEILEMLVDASQTNIRSNVAGNPNATKEILEVLLKDHDSVRYSVAGNPNATKEMLEILSKDHDSRVKSRVVENPNVTREIFEILLHDRSEFVRAAVVKKLLAEY